MASAGDSPIPNTWSGVTYVLVTQHLGRFIAFSVLLVVSFAVAVAVASLFFQPRVKVTRHGVELETAFGPQQYQRLIHPFGWQNTGIELQGGDSLSISASGVVTVGYFEYAWDYLSFRLTPQCLAVTGGTVTLVRIGGSIAGASKPSGLKGEDARCQLLSRSRAPVRWSVNDEDVRWPWVGYIGLQGHQTDPRFQEDRQELGTDWLAVVTSSGANTYGRLVGYIAEPGRTLSRTDQVRGDRVIDLAAFDTGQAVPAQGVLWVAVNDSRFHVHDNMGSIVLTLTKE